MKALKTKITVFLQVLEGSGLRSLLPCLHLVRTVRLNGSQFDNTSLRGLTEVASEVKIPASDWSVMVYTWYILASDWSVRLDTGLVSLQFESEESLIVETQIF